MGSLCPPPAASAVPALRARSQQSSRSFAEFPAAENMQMQVEHGLTGVCTVGDDDAERVVDAELARDLAGSEQ